MSTSRIGMQKYQRIIAWFIDNNQFLSGEKIYPNQIWKKKNKKKNKAENPDKISV